MKKIMLIALLLVATLPVTFAQNTKFGKVSKEELEEKYYPLDSSTNAAYLYRKRNTYTVVTNGEIQLITEIQTRLKIYNKKGFDWATKQVALYGDNSSRERMSGIKAVTYNLENGKIVATKLNKKEIFSENKTDGLTIKKFTMPNVKEGSVLEWTYKIYSPFFTSIDDMVVQHKIPAKNQELRVKLLEWFHFNKRQKGYYPFNIHETSMSNSSFDTNDKVLEIKIKNVPALIEEPYVNSMDNYATALQLEIAALNAPVLQVYKTFATSWSEISKEIYKSPYFGGQLAKNSYFKEDLQNVVNATAPLNEKIIKTFQFVKSKVKWNGVYSKYASKGVKKAYKEGVGNVADINLMLVAMLRNVGVNANPVLVSTRDNGIPLFPTSKGFNYVIAGVEIQDGVILLDATEKYSLPNILPLRDLNWEGRIVRQSGSSNSVRLFPTKHSKQTCFLNTKIDDEGLLTGVERVLYTDLRALQNRTHYNKVSENELVAKIEKDNDDIEIDDFKTMNEDDLSKSLIYQFNFETDNQIEEINGKFYFSPLLFHTEKENPFKLAERQFPIDFGVPWEEKYSISVQIPEGYAIESKPENVAYALPDKLGTYKFAAIVKGDKLQILSDTKINFPIISPIHYGALKAFYKKMIDKQLEKVVLAKK
jgi:hypothetical protein